MEYVTASLAGTGLYTLDLYNIMPRARHNTVNTSTGVHYADVGILYYGQLLSGITEGSVAVFPGHYILLELVLCIPTVYL